MQPAAVLPWLALLWARHGSVAGAAFSWHTARCGDSLPAHVLRPPLRAALEHAASLCSQLLVPKFGRRPRLLLAGTLPESRLRVRLLAAASSEYSALIIRRSWLFRRGIAEDYLWTTRTMVAHLHY
jgi:hypothetical protein